MILNLTQHPASPEQLAAGVVDLSVEQRARLGALLTVETLPTSADISERCRRIAFLAADVLVGPSLSATHGSRDSLADLDRARATYATTVYVPSSCFEDPAPSYGPRAMIVAVAVGLAWGFMPSMMESPSIETLAMGFMAMAHLYGGFLIVISILLIDRWDKRRRLRKVLKERQWQEERAKKLAMTEIQRIARIKATKDESAPKTPR